MATLCIWLRSLWYTLIVKDLKVVCRLPARVQKQQAHRLRSIRQCLNHPKQRMKIKWSSRLENPPALPDIRMGAAALLSATLLAMTPLCASFAALGLQPSPAGSRAALLRGLAARGLASAG